MADTADDDYWWQQRLSDASFCQGQEDAKAGIAPRSVHPSYEMGYNNPEGTGGVAKEDDKPAEAAKRKTPLVVVRSWLQR